MSSQDRGYQATVARVEDDIASLLTGPETRGILTAGEPNEWPLDLKQGDVVLAEAKSDVFDPALEVTDLEHKELSANDDRFPGDQRPFLTYVCPKDGKYFLRCRSFRDKAGGPFTIKRRVLKSVTLSQDLSTTTEWRNRDPFLVRVDLEQGEFAQLADSVAYRRVTVLSPSGLPHVRFDWMFPEQDSCSLFAPVKGEYLVALQPLSNEGHTSIALVKGKLQPFRADEHLPKQRLSLRTVPVKAGVVYRLEIANAPYFAQLKVVDSPSVEKFSLKNAEDNPFFPQDLPPFVGTFDLLAGREMDDRVQVFRAKRDGEILLVASPGDTSSSTLVSRPAAEVLPADKDVVADFRIGDTLYWSFTAEAGDIVKIHASTSTFRAGVVIFDPETRPVSSNVLQPDSTEMNWSFMANKPGTHLIAASAGGGSGRLTLRRNNVPVIPLTVGKPATTTAKTAQTAAFRFVPEAGHVYLVGVSRSKGSGLAVYDAKGEQISLAWIVKGDQQFTLVTAETAGSLTFTCVLDTQETLTISVKSASEQ